MSSTFNYRGWGELTSSQERDNKAIAKTFLSMEEHILR